MKKYKDLTIYCGSFDKALRGIVAIGEMCQHHHYFKYSEEVEKNVSGR